MGKMEEGEYPMINCHILYSNALLLYLYCMCSFVARIYMYMFMFVHLWICDICMWSASVFIFLYLCIRTSFTIPFLQRACIAFLVNASTVRLNIIHKTQYKELADILPTTQRNSY